VELISCPRCHTRVIPKANGECPACGRAMDKAADVPVETPQALSEESKENPYRVGEAAGGSPDERIESQPKAFRRTHRIIRWLGLTNVFAAAFLIVLGVGSLWSLSRLGIEGIARNAGNRPFQIWVIERGLALPLLIALHLWLARGLSRMQGRTILVQTIMSALVASWALFLTLGDVSLLRVALSELDLAPLEVSIAIACYLTKFLSGFGHATIAFLLFRFSHKRTAIAGLREASHKRTSTPGLREASHKRTAIAGASETNQTVNCEMDHLDAPEAARGEARLLGYLLATPAAIVLALGTLWSVRWLILELVRRIFAGAPLS
jgi:hypothetical protein